MINGEKEPDDVFKGIAEEVASCEKDEIRKKVENQFLEQMTSGKFIPAGRILANARPYAKLKNYNNCFTIDLEDSMESIYNSLKEDALISKMGGGVGFNISKLRPKGDNLSRGGESSGPISFLRVFNESAKIIMTGGQRRAAHICILNIDHPDIEEFITVKQGNKNNELTQFNISVGITDEFMKQVEIDGDFDLKWGGKVYKTVKAKYLYNLMVKNAYEHNEPGIFNLDTVEKFNNGYWAFKMDRVNPCGELPMPAYSLCCLGSINLVKFVKKAFTPEAYFDFLGFEKTVGIGVRFLDNVLDVTEYPLQKIENFSKKWRRIGLGFTGLGDTFAMLGTKYGDQPSLILSERIGRKLRDASYLASVALAKEKGTFPQFDKEKYLNGNFIKKLPAEIRDEINEYGIRNIGLNTIAPTGTISLSLGNNCSSGVEPIFSLSYDRNIRTGNGDETKKETVNDYAWLKYQEFYKATNSANLAIDMLAGKGVPVPDFFNTTLEVDPYDGIKIQAAFQEYIDHSISKTANLPTDYTFEKYSNLFMYAYKSGLKGFTSFNPNGSIKGILEHKKDTKFDESVFIKMKELVLKRQDEAGIYGTFIQALVKENKIDDYINEILGKKNIEEDRPDFITRHHAPKRPQDIPCDINILNVKEDRFLVLTGKYNGSLYEIFVTNLTAEFNIDTNSYKEGIIRKNGKGNYSLIVQNGVTKVVVENIGKTFNKDYESMTRLVSACLRHGVPLEFIVEQLGKDSMFGSFGKSVARVMKKYIKDGEKVLSNNECPECSGKDLVYKDGCLTCVSCGWSRCS
jgi:ribonucleoside-diphosphate reductase alpha chain